LGGEAPVAQMGWVYSERKRGPYQVPAASGGEVFPGSEGKKHASLNRGRINQLDSYGKDGPAVAGRTGTLISREKKDPHAQTKKGANWGDA